MPERFPVSTSRVLIATLALLCSGAQESNAQTDATSTAAQPTSASARTLLNWPDPAALLAPARSVRLQRDPDVSPTLLVVTDGRQSPRAVAARYGVAPEDVDLLPATASGVRVQRVKLPRPSLGQPFSPPGLKSHRVRPGETLDTIARQAGVSLTELLGANLDISSLDRVRVGQTVRIPTEQTGVVVRIKPGQTALSVIASYGADLIETAQANGRLPGEFRVGDELLLPGVLAESFHGELVERRAEARKAQAQARIQAQFDRFTAWKKDRERARLQEKYAKQAQYEEYLAWKNSPERQQALAAYQRQVQYEAAQAARRQREAQARQQAATSASTTATPAASNIGRGVGSGLAWPMRNFRLTSRYGERDIEFHRQFFHGGIDLAAPYGTPIYAASSGTVSESGYGAYGLNVYTVNGNSTLVYGHMSRVAVAAGQAVSQGQLLGYVGCTGVCTGPHLHFEIRLGGRTVDPLALLP